MAVGERYEVVNLWAREESGFAVSGFGGFGI